MKGTVHMSQKICPLCGHIENEYAQFCIECGTRLAENVKTVDSEEKSTDDNRAQTEYVYEPKIVENKKRVHGLNGIIVIFIVLIIIIIILKGRKSTEAPIEMLKSSYDATEENNMTLDISDIQKEEKQEVIPSEMEYTEEQSAAEEPERYEKKRSSEYVLPDSDSRYLTYEDLDKLSVEECRLARNELFARHGRRFNDDALQAYFNSCSWYVGTVDPDDFNEKLFNKYELFNRDIIVQYEQDHGYK